jgi:hypothetical protein
MSRDPNYPNGSSNFSSLVNQFPFGELTRAQLRTAEMIERRQFLYGVLAATSGYLSHESSAFAQANDGWPEKFASGIASLENERGGRLGVAVIDTASGRSAAFRGDERFCAARSRCSPWRQRLPVWTAARIAWNAASGSMPVTSW